MYYNLSLNKKNEELEQVKRELKEKEEELQKMKNEASESEAERRNKKNKPTTQVSSFGPFQAFGFGASSFVSS